MLLKSQVESLVEKESYTPLTYDSSHIYVRVHTVVPKTLLKIFTSFLQSTS